jgi:hypothetical protein
VPLQLTCPAWHDTWQVLLLHTCPDVHAVPAVAPLHAPDAPQWALLVVGSMHVPLQLICEAGHETWHVPLLQTCPEEHAAPAFAPLHVPDAPQYVRLDVGSIQVPLQLICPAWHET